MKYSRILTYTLFTLIVIFYSGCAPSTSAIQTAIAKTQAAYTPTPTNIPLTSTPTSTEIPPTPTLEPTPTLQPTNKPNYVFINSGITVSGFCEFRLDDVYFGKKILPPHPGSIYSYYEAKAPDSIYLDVVITFKNLETNSRSADEFAQVTAVFDGQYNYETFPTIEEDKGSDFTYALFTSIEPLLKGTIHYLVEVPKSVETSNKSLRILILVSGKEYIYKYR